MCLLLGLMCIFQALAGLKCVLLCKRGSVRFGNLCRHFSVSVNFSRLCRVIVSFSRPCCVNVNFSLWVSVNFSRYC